MGTNDVRVGWLALVTVLFAVLTVGPANAEPFPICAGRQGNCVVDGDTFQVKGQRIRIENIDAPEIHDARCKDESMLGWRATERLAELLGAGGWKLVRAPGEPRDEDRYGRKLRRLVTRGGDVGDLLVSEGLAKRWTGRKSSWCK